jgi:membrane protein insertase Oxa1/YidC/SpoIIIJ
MNGWLSQILKPIIYLIESYYFLLVNILNSMGLSIMITSLTASIILIPILKIARKKENDVNKKIFNINCEVQEKTSHLNGEEKFFATDAIYKQHQFHPIQNILTGLSFFIVLPVLLSAFIFMNSNLAVMDTTFMNYINLSKPDSLFFGLNIIPLMIFITNYFDARYKYSKRDAGQRTYLILSFVVCMLIYSMPSCLTLYWLTSSLFSLCFSSFYSSNSLMKKNTVE